MGEGTRRLSRLLDPAVRHVLAADGAMAAAHMPGAAGSGRPQPALAASAALRIVSSVAFGVIRLPS